MNHYLLDTNVIIDMLLNREDADAACAVIDGAELGDFQKADIPILDSREFLYK